MAVPTAREAGRSAAPAGVQHGAFGIAPVALAVVAGILLDGRLPATVLLAVAVAAGLPHGAFDHAVGRRTFHPRYGARWWRPFLGGYLALASAMLVMWWAIPGAALLLFLALSLLHFGDEDAPIGTFWRAMRIVAHGGAVIVVPAACHPAATERLFAMLAPAQAALVETLLGGPVALLWAASTVGTVALHAMRGRAGDRTAIANLVLVVLLFALATPLVAFATYFVAIHTPRALAASLPGHGLRARTLLLPALLSLLGIALGVAIFVAGAGMAIGENVVRSTFMLLSALTVPHMWLEWRARLTEPSAVEPSLSNARRPAVA